MKIMFVVEEHYVNKDTLPPTESEKAYELIKKSIEDENYEDMYPEFYKDHFQIRFLSDKTAYIDSIFTSICDYHLILDEFASPYFSTEGICADEFEVYAGQTVWDGGLQISRDEMGYPHIEIVNCTEEYPMEEVLEKMKEACVRIKSIDWDYSEMPDPTNRHRRLVTFDMELE